jgi:hypothetical protein
MVSKASNQPNHNLKTYLFLLCILGKDFWGDKLPLTHPDSLSNQIYTFRGEFPITWPLSFASVASCLEERIPI